MSKEIPNYGWMLSIDDSSGASTDLFRLIAENEDEVKNSIMFHIQKKLDVCPNIKMKRGPESPDDIDKLNGMLVSEAEFDDCIVRYAAVPINKATIMLYVDR